MNLWKCEWMWCFLEADQVPDQNSIDYYPCCHGNHFYKVWCIMLNSDREIECRLLKIEKNCDFLFSWHMLVVYSLIMLTSDLWWDVMICENYLFEILFLSIDISEGRDWFSILSLIFFFIAKLKTYLSTEKHEYYSDWNSLSILLYWKFTLIEKLVKIVLYLKRITMIIAAYGICFTKSTFTYIYWYGF